MTGAVLSHVTLASGNVARHTRSTLLPKTEAVIHPLVRDLMAGGAMIPRTRDVPWTPGYVVQCLTIHGPAAPLFRVYGPAPNPVPEDGAELPMLVTVGVGMDAGDGAAALWRQLHEWNELTQGGRPTDPERPPDAPWCGVACHEGLVLDPGATEWLGDFERCIAWAAILETEGRA